MAVRTRKSTPKYGLKEKLAAYAIGFASLVPVPNSAAINYGIGEANAEAVQAQTVNERKALVAASFRNELQDEQIQKNTVIANGLQPDRQAAYSQSAAIAISSSESVWDKLAQCESGGNWSINTGNGYYGGVQFSLGTWKAMGGTGLPSEASREQQIEIAKALQSRSGWGQWPACSKQLGLIS